MYDKLNNIGIETIIDDRYESVGIKFNDIDLIGVPLRITVGQKYESGYVEFKKRNSEKSKDISINDIIITVIDEIDKGVYYEREE